MLTERWYGSGGGRCTATGRDGIESGWWHELEHADMADFLTELVHEFADDDRRAALSLQLQMAVTATADLGFAEQRIMMGGSGLEHLMWQTLVLGGQMTKEQYKRGHAHDLLRRVLIDTGVPVDIDPTVQPTLAQFAVKEEIRQGRRARPLRWSGARHAGAQPYRAPRGQAGTDLPALRPGVGGSGVCFGTTLPSSF